MNISCKGLFYSLLNQDTDKRLTEGDVKYCLGCYNKEINEEAVSACGVLLWMKNKDVDIQNIFNHIEMACSIINIDKYLMIDVLLLLNSENIINNITIKNYIYSLSNCDDVGIKVNSCWLLEKLSMREDVKAIEILMNYKNDSNQYINVTATKKLQKLGLLKRADS